jgi:hypothetical protein
MLFFFGVGLLWKIYQGYKKTTKQEAAIFVFEKRQLERWPRSDREAMLEMLRRGVSQLTRLRHPQILIVQHPLEESRYDIFIFILVVLLTIFFALIISVLFLTQGKPGICYRACICQSC